MNNLNLVPIDAANDPVNFYSSFGSHATCMSRANSIVSDGFRPDGAGRRGKGVYLWHAESIGCDYARRLAHHWYLASNKRQEYKDESDQSGAVLWCSIKVPEDELLNLERPEFRAVLRKALSHHWQTIAKQNTPEAREALVCSVHQMLIEKAEINKPVSVVLATVLPPKMPDELAGFVGQPFAMIVRNLGCLDLQKNIERVTT